MKEKVEAFISLAEKIPSNAYAISIICIGAVLVVCKHEEAGKATLASGFTIFSHKS